MHLRLQSRLGMFKEKVSISIYGCVEAIVRLPSKFVFKKTASVSLLAAAISISVSTSIRFILDVHSDTITIIVRLVLPFVIAIPVALVWFTRLESLQNAYRDLVRHSNELARTASSDPLTGVMNRRAFIEQFEGAMQLSIKGWFLIADIDFLKKINDNFGHPTGDDAILCVAKGMQKKLPAEALLARIGGDEFCAFVPKTSDREIRETIQNINVAVEELFAKSRKDISQPLSISIDFCPSNVIRRSLKLCRSQMNGFTEGSDNDLQISFHN